jgi:hypothetical protein
VRGQIAEEKAKNDGDDALQAEVARLREGKKAADAAAAAAAALGCSVCVDVRRGAAESDERARKMIGELHQRLAASSAQIAAGSEGAVALKDAEYEMAGLRNDVRPTGLGFSVQGLGLRVEPYTLRPKPSTLNP